MLFVIHISVGVVAKNVILLFLRVRLSHDYLLAFGDSVDFCELYMYPVLKVHDTLVY